MSHANARTTFHGRCLIVQRHLDGVQKSEIARGMGISRKCVDTWVDRYEEEGWDGLHDRSSRPHNSPRQTPAEVEEKVLAARAEHRRGPDWLAHETGVPARTITRILRRHEVALLAMCDPMTGEVIKTTNKHGERYERATPGELCHMDVKKQARIPDGGGLRVPGLSSPAAKAAGVRAHGRVGYDFVHTLIDDCSRLAYSEALPDETASTCAAFLMRAAEYFAGRGIPEIQRLMTDNALAYKSHAMAEVCALLEIQQKYIKPHCPWTNGKVERFNRTLATEWAYARVYTSNEERTAALADYIEHYNNVRRHTALGFKPPISRL